MIYHLMKEQIESGQTFINDSVSFKNFSKYLIDDKRWKHKASVASDKFFHKGTINFDSVVI